MKERIGASYMRAMKAGGFEPKAKPEAKEMPPHVQKMAHGGLACMHCGGEVGEDGESEAIEGKLSGEPHDVESLWRNG